MTADCRKDWPAGPWDDEPDRVDFEAHGMRCQIRRVTSEWAGHLCGYVEIPEGHPWHGVDDETRIPADPHGGVTLSGLLDEGGPWMVGFDCAHAWDISPGSLALQAHMGRPVRVFEGEVYRDLAYVRAQTEELARLASERILPWDADTFEDE